MNYGDRKKGLVFFLVQVRDGLEMGRLLGPGNNNRSQLLKSSSGNTLSRFKGQTSDGLRVQACTRPQNKKSALCVHNEDGAEIRSHVLGNQLYRMVKKLFDTLLPLEKGGQFSYAAYKIDGLSFHGILPLALFLLYTHFIKEPRAVPE